MNIPGRINLPRGKVGNAGNPYRTLRRGAPVNYGRCTTRRGSGFILAKVSETSRRGGCTRLEVYDRKDYNTLLWSALLDDGLISVVNGRWVESTRHSYWKRPMKIRAIASNSKEPPRYVITQLGQKVLDEIRARESRG